MAWGVAIQHYYKDILCKQTWNFLLKVDGGTNRAEVIHIKIKSTDWVLMSAKELGMKIGKWFEN